MIDNPVEWFQSKIRDVENEQKREAALFDMKSYVLNAESSVLKNLVYNVSLNTIFECLGDPTRLNEEELQYICVIIVELLMQLSPNELLDYHIDFLRDGLIRNSGELTRIVVKLLEKNIDEYTTKETLERISPLIPEIITCMCSSEIVFPEAAKSVLIKIGTNPHGVNLLFKNGIIKKLEEVMSRRDTAKIRVCEMIIEVSKLSPENLTKANASGLLDKILLEFSLDDVIMQLCILGNLSNLARSNHGLTYLLELEFVKNLEENLLALNNKQMSSTLLPGIIEFFGTLCYLQPEKFVNHNPHLLGLLFTSLNTTDEDLLGILIETVGQIGSTSLGRCALNQHENSLNIYCKKVGEILSTKNNLTISALHSLCELVKFIEGDESGNLVAQKWFESVTPSALDSSVRLAKLPFIECRMAAFEFLSAIAAQGWGMVKLVNYPGMIEFLTNRSTEFDKRCKETKFNIVYNIVHCENVEQVVGQQVLLNLNRFVSEGPFYVAPAVDMATEEAI